MVSILHHYAQTFDVLVKKGLVVLGNVRRAERGKQSHLVEGILFSLLREMVDSNLDEEINTFFKAYIFWSQTRLTL